MNIQITNDIDPADRFLVDGVKDLLQKPSNISSLVKNDLADATFILTDATGWVCEAGPEFRTVRINITVLQVFYAYSYAYYTYYEQVCRGVTPNGQVIPMTNEGILPIVKSLLTWATGNLTGKVQRSYTDETSLPPLPSLYNDVIFKLFLNAIAFYILHEMMHLKLNLPPSIDEERACDRESAALLLSSSEVEDWSERARGVAISLTLMNVIGMNIGIYNSLVHPFAYDRLLDSLTPFCNNQRDTVWDWVVGLFALHMTESKIAQPHKEFDSFYECVLEYRDILDKHRREFAEGTSIEK